jgi:hypothetical protein
MARWRLKSAHYLNVPGATFEVRETSRETGKQAIKHFPVHTYLNPDDPSDHNYPGEIIVADKANKAFPRDIVMAQPPTMEMEPIDEEAEKISAQWEKKWANHPIDSLPATMSQV